MEGANWGLITYREALLRQGAFRGLIVPFSKVRNPMKKHWKAKGKFSIVMRNTRINTLALQLDLEARLGGSNTLRLPLSRDLFVLVKSSAL